MTEKFELSEDVLDWAAAEAGMSLREAAERVSKKETEDIISGSLTEPQVFKFAKVTKVPLGFLFREAPPAPRKLPIADFRTVFNRAHGISRDLIETFEDIQYKQSWYRDYLLAHEAEPLPFIGRFNHLDAKVEEVACDIRNELDFHPEMEDHLRTAQELFSFFSAKAEASRVLVFKNGVVGNNTKRPLSVREFRGFAIADEVAPVIFVNGRDAPSAWSFTLAHELAHLWLGESAVSDANVDSEIKVERFCNAVAAEVLVPGVVFRSSWDKLDPMDVDGKLVRLRQQFKVSELVLAIKARTLGLLDKDAFNQIYERTKNREANKGEGGGNFYATAGVRNSKALTYQVTSLAISGAISFRDAGKLLRIAPNSVMALYKRQREIPA